ncbi:cAMP-dependent protein kinase inhibitor alpha [Grus japonensis]|uniref:cAMP-dependent protein kinase inhibitor alpha n=1 Tax=Grus japonensis TaxID=30415 RepID=A0ABC9W5C6_GRUJA
MGLALASGRSVLEPAGVGSIRHRKLLAASHRSHPVAAPPPPLPKPCHANPTQPLLILGIAPTHVQDLALGLVELHEVHMGPPLKPVQVPLDGIPSLRCVNCTTQLGVICKLAECALDPTVYVIDEDIKQYWSQYRPLRDTTCHIVIMTLGIPSHWEGIRDLKLAQAIAFFEILLFSFYTLWWAEPRIHSPHAGLDNSGRHSHSSNELREIYTSS